MQWNHVSALRFAKVFVAAGMLAAAVEMMFVLPIQYARGAAPTVVFQSIASGALGRRAYTGGLSAAILGLGFHVLISLVAAGLYTVAAIRWEWLRRRPISGGVIYGVLVYMAMNFVVIPLSTIGFRWPRSVPLFLMSLGVHMFAFGLPIAAVCARLLGRNTGGAA